MSTEKEEKERLEPPATAKRVAMSASCSTVASPAPLREKLRRPVSCSSAGFLRPVFS
jgi:hypothetical protein